MAGREYLTRQAATLLRFAQAITDPDVTLGLVDKANDLKAKAEAAPSSETGPEAPDDGHGE
ncbi:hypothetical protein JJB99_24195 [Bradyrhizobium diazoefficiens]|uniref:hypothetical protein n=1 Tax=Bradyrhizobium diazoefficiens TaxID=1355477 RepID=UPI00190CE90D|nr:hypothetical protein [Bradyrhizobium diazoefficiens]QQO12555.1 hypothetical protein JJB99_24195 [Bradyrhizobium diazoefficiens]